jgi:hypothetical protein
MMHTLRLQWPSFSSEQFRDGLAKAEKKNILVSHTFASSELILVIIRKLEM